MPRFLMEYEGTRGIENCVVEAESRSDAEWKLTEEGRSAVHAVCEMFPPKGMDEK